jgi:hypothetical protein
MKHFSKIGILFFSITLSGCGMKFVSYNELLQRHKGENIETFISDWGAPQSTTPLPSGNTIYLFISEKQVNEKTSEIKSEKYGVNRDGKSTAIYSNVVKACKTTVTANKKSEIISLSAQGEGCEGKWMKEN